MHFFWHRVFCPKPLLNQINTFPHKAIGFIAVVLLSYLLYFAVITNAQASAEGIGNTHQGYWLFKFFIVLQVRVLQPGRRAIKTSFFHILKAGLNAPMLTVKLSNELCFYRTK